MSQKVTSHSFKLAAFGYRSIGFGLLGVTAALLAQAVAFTGTTFTALVLALL